MTKICASYCEFTAGCDEGEDTLVIAKTSYRMASLNPFLLAANVPDPDPRLLPMLRADPAIAPRQDDHGYSLLHAAASYNHLDLLRTLVSEFHVDVNLRDEDEETCLFVVETVEAARCLVEELAVDVGAHNNEGQTAREKFEAEAEFPEVAAYLARGAAAVGELSFDPEGRPPPPLPPNVQLSIGNSDPEIEAAMGSQEPDPEFRRRIEELASRENFHTEEGQRELRDLICDAVRDVNREEHDSQRRRLG